MRPTADDVKQVWDSLRTPTVRGVADELRARGYEISFATVGRWQREGFKPRVKTQNRKVTWAGEGLQDAVAGAPDPKEMVLIERRYTDLMLQSMAELDATEAKARKVFNILLMESAARRTRVLALIPRETAALVVAMTGAAGAQSTGGHGQLPAAGDPRTIEGTINEVDPDNETVAAIESFRRKLRGDKVA